ncbi:CDP-alcohol phosphatidyltransferase family protein [Membranicola marinus]|uniref:CDP-alcohol phosphatidyltransferase family protein n=1 Tax=Membranihabitans marinus TaxID=1227546 RepID=A0A953LAB4_9BACT|nr:CDP-alcohol phosphatidyltransferase family protein [Membranihabitans marinus]MBY5957431.1 CDP-alcohol phosphatidyltransferase family protein [Membranihabitans marinus]
MFSWPNIFTLLNLVCGCIALFGIFYESSWVVIITFGLALIFDFLDGFSARLLSQTSELGKQLDSLADLISFGVFPTFLLIDIVERSVEIREWPVYGLIFLLAAGAALRLARFNTGKEGDSGFMGMPSPAMAMTVFAIWVNLDNTVYPSLEMLSDPVFILILSLFLTFMMNISLRFIKFSLGNSYTLDQILSLLLILIFLGGLFVNWRLAVLITSLSYIILSLLFPLFSRSARSS